MAVSTINQPLDHRLDHIWEVIYPVGAIYMSTVSTSPATLFGGTWSQIKGQFLYACEDSGITAGSTGGAKSVSYTPAGTNSGGSVGSHTLTTTEIPAHAHGLNGHVHSGPSHYHGLNGHTHSYTYPTGSTGGNSGNTSSTTISFSNGIACAYVGSGSGKGYIDVRQKSGSFTPTYGFTNSSNAYNTSSGHSSAFDLGGSQAHTHTHNGHTHTVNTGSTNTGGNSGNTAAAGTGNTGGNSGNTANAGGGGGHNHGFTNPTFSGTAATIATMPPYLAVYVWQRTA